MSYVIHVVSGANEGAVVDLKEGEAIRVGRNPGNDLVLAHDSWISGKHALIKAENHKISLNDLDSTNGTFLERQKIGPGVYCEVADFCVTGSTIIAVASTPKDCPEAPAPLSAVAEKDYAKHPVYCEAAALAKGQPFLTSAYLFLALARLHDEAIRPFFHRLGFEFGLDELQERVVGNRIFKGSLGWLNKYLGLGDRIALTEPLATPKAQRLAEALAAEPHQEPLQLLAVLLDDEFNLAFPILDWRQLKRNWTLTIEDLLGVRSDIGDMHREILMPETKSFLTSLSGLWQELEAACGAGGAAALTGSRGSGKTSALQLCFKEQGGHRISAKLNAGPVSMFDPRAFLFFNAPVKLKPYLSGMLEALHAPQLVVVDHFDELLLQLQGQNVDRAPLFEAVRRRAGPTILCLRRENLEMIENRVGTLAKVDLNGHLKAHLPALYGNLLSAFERRYRGILSERARAFFNEKVAAADPYNLGGMKDFLTLCAGKADTIDSSFADLGESTRALGRLGDACFRDVYDAWLRKPDRQAAVKGSGAADKTLRQIEELFHNCAKHLFNVHLRYGDQTRRFDEAGRLTRDQKLDELKSHLVAMFSTLQSSFPQWFETFWMKLDPVVIRHEAGSANAKRLWDAYVANTKNIDSDYAQDLYHEAIARVFLETLKREN